MTPKKKPIPQEPPVEPGKAGSGLPAGRQGSAGKPDVEKADKAVEAVAAAEAKATPLSVDPAAHQRELGDELSRIYDATGSPPDMSRLDQARHSTMKKVLVGLLVFFAVLAAVSWAGFFFFSPERGKFSGEGVTLEIEGPAEVKSGELTTFAFRYKNGEHVPLGTAGLEVRLPKAFKLQSAEPASDDFEWRLGSIAPRKDGLVKVTGIFLAPVGRELDLQAILSYRPADFNSEFQKVSTRTVRIADSVIDLGITGPPKVLPGDKVTLTFTYKNGSENAFENLKLLALFPDKFIPESSEPGSVEDGLKEWDIAALPPGGEGTVKVAGSFASDSEGTLEIKGQIGFLGADEQFELQKEASFSTDVLKGDLVTALILNGKADSQPIRFGDTLRYAVSWRNTGTVTLDDVTLSVVFETVPAGKFVLWSNLEDKARGVRDNNRITWTKRQVPSLGRVDAGDEGTLDFEVPILQEPLPGATDGNYQVTSWLEASVAAIDGTPVTRTTKTPPIVAKVVSDTKLTATARYFNEDGIPVGSGPLPPKVGEATTYRVNWRIDNNLHELTDLTLSAKLPPNVRWTGSSTVDAGDLRFDAAAEKMVWTLNWMPTSIKTLSVTFDVAITPTPDQQDRVPTLVDATILEAIDKVTGYPILLSQPPLTTAIEADENAVGKGRVE